MEAEREFLGRTVEDDDAGYAYVRRHLLEESRQGSGLRYVYGVVPILGIEPLGS